MRQIYVPRRFQGNSREIIERANEIIAEYQTQGYRLTLRQLYYQFVARDLFPNAGKNYKLLGRMMVWARAPTRSDNGRAIAILDVQKEDPGTLARNRGLCCLQLMG